MKVNISNKIGTFVGTVLVAIASTTVLGAEKTFTPPPIPGVVHALLKPDIHDSYVADNSRVYQDIDFTVVWGPHKWGKRKITMRADLDHCILLKMTHWNHDSHPLTISTNALILHIWQPPPDVSYYDYGCEAIKEFKWND